MPVAWIAPMPSRAWVRAVRPGKSTIAANPAVKGCLEEVVVEAAEVPWAVVEAVVVAEAEAQVEVVVAEAEAQVEVVVAEAEAVAADVAAVAGASRSDAA